MTDQDLFEQSSKELLSKSFNQTKDELQFYVEDLSLTEPEFVKYLEEFLAGEFTLVSKEQDEMLTSISEVLFAGKKLTKKQIDVFKSRCSYYLDLIRKKEELKEPTFIRKSGDEVLVLFENLEDNQKDFSTREKRIITDIAEYYQGHGSISEKQFSYLTSLYLTSVQRRNERVG